MSRIPECKLYKILYSGILATSLSPVPMSYHWERKNWGEIRYQRRIANYLKITLLHLQTIYEYFLNARNTHILSEPNKGKIYVALIPYLHSYFVIYLNASIPPPQILSPLSQLEAIYEIWKEAIAFHTKCHIKIDFNVWMYLDNWSG